MLSLGWRIMIAVLRDLVYYETRVSCNESKRWPTLADSQDVFFWGEVMKQDFDRPTWYARMLRKATEVSAQTTSVG